MTAVTLLKTKLEALNEWLFVRPLAGSPLILHFISTEHCLVIKDRIPLLRTKLLRTFTDIFVSQWLMHCHVLLPARETSNKNESTLQSIEREIPLGLD